MLPWLNSSWVTGKTGFNLVGSWKATGSIVHEGGPLGRSARLGQKEPPSSRHSEASTQPVLSPTRILTTTDMEIPANSFQTKEFSTASSDVEVSTAGVGVFTQGTPPQVTFTVKEVYWRRDGLTFTPLKGIDSLFLEEGSNLCENKEKQTCIAPSSGLLEGDASRGGLEESAAKAAADDPGHGLKSLDSLGESLSCHLDNGGVSEVPHMMVGEVTKELEVSPIMKALSLVMEVSRVVGLSCDGQEGLQEDCFKRIIVEKHGKGGGSFHSTDRQEEDSPSWERVNCSVYET
jgi:hypothetical protein